MNKSAWAEQAAKYAAVRARAFRRLTRLPAETLSALASEILGREITLNQAQFAVLCNVRFQVVERRGVLKFADIGRRLTPTDRALLDELSAMGLIDKEQRCTVRHGLEDALGLSFDGLDVVQWVEENA
jgi:hypothetical protein